jgi:hypothetical protein
MKEEILTHQQDAKQLEKLYRGDKNLFKREFASLYPQLAGTPLADFWQERLHYESEDISWGTGREVLLLILAALFAGFIAKIPAIFGIEEELFYTRNVAFIVLPLLTAYFGWRSKLSTGKIAFAATATLAGLLFINLFPHVKQSDTLILSCIHLPLFLWVILGFAFVGGAEFKEEKRLGFLKYNGDLVVMTTLILIAGGIMTGLTIGLFTLIGFDIREFYFENIALIGLAAAPLVGTYLTQTNPQLVGKVSPVIARIFSPLVVVMLVVYLVAMVYSRKNPYNSREFLLIFNALLVGVMALTFFSVAETSKSKENTMQTWVLFLLSVVTIIVNGVALSAILLRITDGGFTPNRAAVLGGNVIILVNLLLVTAQLFRAISKKGEINGVGNTIARYLPVYFIWAFVVAFIFPLLFGFK